MRRRDFLAASAAAAAVSATRPSTLLEAAPREPFKLGYAPPLGMVRNHAEDPVDQVHFLADQGFRAIEDNGMKGRPVRQQEAIRKALDEHGMEMGVFVAHAEWQRADFASRDPAATERIVANMREAVEVAQRVGARWCTVVPGRFDDRVEPEFQMAWVIDNLRRACEVCEPAGLVMVLEPLNRRDHPGMYLARIPQAYAICRAVDSPSCKILFDMYHQQITEGNIIPNIDTAWDEIAYFQIGDNPGRKEPTTGEINYANVFAHLRRKGFTGVVGMEHGNAKSGAEGEMAVVAAYRAVDPAR